MAAMQEADTAHEQTRAITPRAVVVAIIANIAVVAWVQYSELVTPTSQMSESTPPIPAILSLGVIASLAVLMWRVAKRLSFSRSAGGRAMGKAAGKLSLDRHETLTVYLFLIVACAMPSVGIVRLILPCLMELQYFGMPSNNFEEMAKHIPSYWAPTQGEAVRTFWESVNVGLPPSGVADWPVVGGLLDGFYRFFGQTTAVPWNSWAVPFVVWSGYLIVYFVSSFCLITLFRRKWSDDDRLAFPIARMSMDLFGGASFSGAKVPFLRDPIMWIGFSLAVLYNGLNMIKVFNPSVPAMGLSFPVGQLFTERPWDSMAGMAVWYKPEIMGFGYVVPADIQLSIFVFSLLQWFARPMAAVAGYQIAGFPFSRAQAAGALIILALYFIYQARGRLREVWRKAIKGDPSIDDSAEPLSHRAALFGAVGGLLILVAFPIIHGVTWWHAASYLGVGTLFLIAYCRNRAETGLPIVWGYPLLLQKKILTNLSGRVTRSPSRCSRCSCFSSAVRTMLLLARHRSRASWATNWVSARDARPSCSSGPPSSGSSSPCGCTSARTTPGAGT